MIYNPNRFKMNRMYHTNDKQTLTNPEKLNDFVKAAVVDQLPLYWETEKMPKTKYSWKLVGEDFEKKILDAKRDTLVLIKHPDEAKNRKLAAEFEDLARQNSLKDLTLARYRGLNESAAFKSPTKLPALIYFRAPRDAEGKATSEEKEVVVFSQVNDLLVKGIKGHEVQARINQFIS